MAALDAAIQGKTRHFNDFWMAGSRPAMTARVPTNLRELFIQKRRNLLPADIAGNESLADRAQ
jgi:hypothetical protein